jgi:AcrR family transcriptional regulator
VEQQCTISEIMSTDFRRRRSEPSAAGADRDSQVGPRSARRDRTGAAILDAAAHLLAERGEAPLAEVALAAGVGRTTLYRYFPAREKLLEALAEAALAEAAERLEAAGLEDCPVDEALARIFRALLAVGDRYIVLVREQVPLDRDALERTLGGPILAAPLAARALRRRLDSRAAARLRAPARARAGERRGDPLLPRGRTRVNESPPSLAAQVASGR